MQDFLAGGCCEGVTTLARGHKMLGSAVQQASSVSAAPAARWGRGGGGRSRVAAAAKKRAYGAESDSAPSGRVAPDAAYLRQAQLMGLSQAEAQAIVERMPPVDESSPQSRQ